MTISLSSLRTQVRQRADMENSEFIKDSELNTYINMSYNELYDVIVATFEDYYTKVEYHSVASGGNIPLPADFYKLRGVDKSRSENNPDADDWFTVTKFNFAERNLDTQVNRIAQFGLYDVKYRVMGDSMEFSPKGHSEGYYRLWYIPQCPALLTDTDTTHVVNGWEEYIIIDAAIKCLQKEESDVSVLAMQKAAIIKRIEAMAPNRDAGSPERVADVTTTGVRRFGFFGGF